MRFPYQKRTAYVALAGCLLIGLVWWAGMPRRLTIAEPTGSFDSITIAGDDEFLLRVTAALALLRSKAPGAYQLVTAGIRHIQQGAYSGMWADLDLPTFELAKPTYTSSMTWLAGAIAHDSIHSTLWRNYLRDYGRPVPDEIWIGVEVELACNAHMLAVLQQIGAPAWEVDWLARQDGTHSDTNKDGRVDWRDRRPDW